MSKRRPPIIERRYEPNEGACVRALEFLLEKSVSKEGTRPGAPDDAEDLENDRTATKNHSR